MPTQLILLSNPQIDALQAQVVTIYREAFTPPPYNTPDAEIADFAQALTTQFDRDGYRFVGAFDGVSGRLVGFAYGFACVPQRW